MTRPWLRRIGYRRFGRVDVGGELEAVLAGRYVEWLRGRGEPVPAWAWLNGLAHGGLGDVSALAAQRHLFGRVRDWRRARRLLAGEIVAVAGDRLGVVQREVLVPLELRLAARGNDAALDPARLAARVLMALDRSSSFGRRGDSAVMGEATSDG